MPELAKLRGLPDVRFVYMDWGGPERAWKSKQPLCHHGHRWTVIAPWILRSAQSAGLARPNWYAGPTYSPYCERCGIYRDQDEARRRRWKVLAMLDGISSAGDED